MIAAGTALSDATLSQRGLDLLAWLVAVETADGHLSPTPVGVEATGTSGPASTSGPSKSPPLPTRVRAAAIDANPIWPGGVKAAANWFMGDNDAGSRCGIRKRVAVMTRCTRTGWTVTRVLRRPWR